MSVVFYVSGHGFGHASRVIEIVNALGRLAPQVPLHIRTAASPWLFDWTLRVPATVHRVDTDTGMVQVDSLRLDVVGSLERAHHFYRTLADRARTEARDLARLAPRLVVADLPPLAFVAAAIAGVPSMAVGNFTWDWIYEAYPEQPRVAPGVPEALRAAHALAEGAWRLPMHGGFAGFRHVEDVPLVARHATRHPDEVRTRLGLPLDRRVVLVSFGGYGLDWPSARPLASVRHHLALTAGSDEHIARARAQLGRNTTVIDERVMRRDGIRYEDLVRASDAVASKPGYGIIAECIANQRALLYTDRGAFVEYEVLLAALPRWLRARYMPHELVFGGEWDAEIDALLTMPAPPERPPTDGAEVVANRIVDRLTRARH